MLEIDVESRNLKDREERRKIIKEVGEIWKIIKIKPEEK